MEAAQVPWRPLGELFVDRGLISREELETTLAEQAATGKRLGEILVDRGLVSGPDLTGALMDQLGVEISKEEGYGSGLWAEIKRRHKRVRPDEADDVPPPAIALAEQLPVGPEPEREPERVPVPVLAPVLEPVPVAVSGDAAALRAELEAARTDLAHLHEMLVDAMTAPAALSAEAAAEQHAG